MKPLTTPNSIDPELSLGLATAVLKAAGDELRAKILRILQRDAFGVLELSRIFTIRQPAMSHHLKILSKAGLVTFRREGTCIFYRRSYYEQDGLDLLRQQIFTQLDQCPLANDIEQGIETIHQERAETSQAFFHNNAERFREQQDLIASCSQYGDSVIQLIDELQLPDSKTALEIGPGEGDLLPELAARFKKVIALDNSEPMLERSKALITKNGITKVEFLLGNIGSLSKPIEADIITLNMVLHHLAQPADTLKAIGALLNDGGALIITELCQHDQDWAHSACGDLWLGFCPEELAIWAKAAGLDEGKSQFLTQRNGFRIQLRQFLKPASS
ncbi:MAG: metalloregulator ArsR/SmtB family transcription factor [Porticoccaceae bacterium]|nr:metalloregulator ArsR/SmtB family transcription factor [Porticoccaceae bacterium]